MKELEGFKQWLVALNYSQKKIYQYVWSTRRMLKWTKRTPRTVTQNNIFAYFDNEKQRLVNGKPLTPNYINSELSALRTFARYMKQNHGVHFPIGHLTCVKSKQRTPNYLTEKEVSELFDVTNNSKYGYRDRAMLAICYGGGLRRSEAVKLHVKDIDIRRGYIHVREGKNYKDRIVPLPPKAIKHITEYLKHGRPLLKKGIHYQRELFLGYRGKSLTAQVFEKRIRVLAEMTNNPELIAKKVTMHLLRHSIATHLLNRGVAIENVSMFLGHSSLDSTQVYTHIIPP
ncbi:MAG: tyrosine-type recombinase/integrase [Crocinitomicaceae bacterium]|nr:tyrosine-type recombinase/integrase [Crocinitomicaceae bacterium]